MLVQIIYNSWVSQKFCKYFGTWYHPPWSEFYKETILLFTNPSARAGYDTRSIFKWSLTGLNSEFSFS